MAKHKNITEGMIDNFLDKVFKKAFDQNYDSAMKAVKKQDPELAKDMAKVDDIIDNYKKKLSKLPKKEQERRVQKAWDSIK
jgi:phosphate uptake regulator|tara:strand:- start:16 stop:258 length:243 start_codon:yes stop_codon:yes gene_type:complete